MRSNTICIIYCTKAKFNLVQQMMFSVYFRCNFIKKKKTKKKTANIALFRVRTIILVSVIQQNQPSKMMFVWAKEGLSEYNFFWLINSHRNLIKLIHFDLLLQKSTPSEVFKVPHLKLHQCMNNTSPGDLPQH